MKIQITKYLLLLLPALLLWACSSDKGKASDSDSAPVAAAEPEEVLEEFSSPDLGLWNLTGPVSGAVFYSYEVNDTLSQPDQKLVAGLDSITFNRQGLVTSMVSGLLEGGKPAIDSDLRFEYNAQGDFVSGKEAATGGGKLFVKLSRSSGGYLQVVQVLGSDRELSADGCYYRIIEWTRGLLYSSEVETNEGTFRSTYTNNAEGLPEKVVTKVSDMGGETRIEEQYRYTKFDKYGNWTERRVLELTDITEGEADGTNMKTTSHRTHRLDRRSIYYYPPRDSLATMP